MSDTPRTDARLGYENEHHGANMPCRELERELNQAIEERDELKREFGFTYCTYCGRMFEIDKPDAADAIGEHIRTCKKHPMRLVERERDENKAGWDNASLVALRLERERNEARECLREAVSHADSFHEAYPIEQVERWRKAAGLEKT